MSGQVSLTSLSITQDLFKYLLAHLKQSKSTTVCLQTLVLTVSFLQL